MHFFTFLFASAVAIHSTTGTFHLAKKLVDKNVEVADTLASKVLNSGTHETYDIHINRQPVCADCTGKANNDGTSVPARPGSQSKGRYYYYPTSYYYPPTAYYYYPNSYAVPVASHQGAQRRVGVYGQGSAFNHAYFVYPSAPIPGAPVSGLPVSGLPVSGVPVSHVPVSHVPVSHAPVAASSVVRPHKNTKPAHVQDYYNPGFQPYQFAPVPVSVYPPFSKLVRQKSGRPVVSPIHHRYPDYAGFKGSSSSSSSDPVKGGSTTEATTTTTEDTVEQEQQQEQEQEQTTEDSTGVKGYY